MRRYGLMVANEELFPNNSKFFAVVNPATGESVAEVVEGTRDDAKAALKTALRAFREWSRIPPVERGQVLTNVASLLRERADQLGRLLTMEQGRPLAESVGEVKRLADTLEFFAHEARVVLGEVPWPDHTYRFTVVLKEPVGVVTAITPWNYPLLLLGWKLGPALATGCTVVAKPASLTPLTTLEVAKLFAEAGAPAGIFNVVPGKGSVVGDELVINPLSRKVAFTGSTEVGRHVMELASQHVKRVSLELGGHNPALVCADADLEIAVDALIHQAFRNAGQVCNRPNRIYIEEPVFEAFVSRFVERTEKIRVGNGLEPEVHMGPLVDEAQLQTVERHVQDAVAKGAKVITGGRRLTGGEYRRGYFYPATVLTDINESMVVMREETFGPVVPLLPMRDLKAGVKQANDTAYGLSAFLFTNRLKEALEAVRDLEVGTLWVNDTHSTYLQAPYGGVKESGLGRELSHHGLEEYLELKYVCIDTSPTKRGGYFDLD